MDYNKQKNKNVENSEWNTKKLDKIDELINYFYIDLIEVISKTNIELTGDLTDDAIQIKKLAKYCQKYLEESKHRLQEKLHLYSLVKLYIPKLINYVRDYWDKIRSVEAKIRKFYGYIFNCLEGYSIYELDIYNTIKEELDTEMLNMAIFLRTMSDEIKHETDKLKI